MEKDNIMKVPGYMWFKGYKIFELRFHDELFELQNIEYKNYGTIRRMRMKKRKAAFRASMLRMNILTLTICVLIIGFTIWRSF
ncbi:hypothetical protein LCGC14_2540350 [marine sediment metagenome]|uniref:Uncharacterized protein n=1 Tax=marine sediment metagenome TaxID=412755 RepID=A0A0F9BDN9_9ZZZZ